ncbi:nitric oxide reductase transcriptional regulator NorR [Chitiniphilus purpureus]|uniref:Nitric oxide reductase transcriptional regulator NorR n=1 Tax=Chitiniphilus purpureus TaxID=2981137 RepID=A0ABY6DKL6_9NEIS|nr:nitric oxide reductase transcriptional regulator NorR [Chitiniphilus sp. CD1]UXY13656.1 nitric oxide reductase transcriptional regulator NorR [Chitiniphilus sp. CD1]
MIDVSLLADLAAELPQPIRLQRLLASIHAHYGCHAVGLLRSDGDSLYPLAAIGLSQETLGRRFVVAQHPRLAAILAQREPVRFVPGSPLPDPYDGLLADQPGAPLAVHDCLGVRLEVEGRVWGALTLDAFAGRTFAAGDLLTLPHYALLAASEARMGRLEGDLRALRQGVGNPAGSAGIGFELVGQSPAWLAMLQELDGAAASDLPILLLGETGTGKELLAHRVHQRSARHDRPLVHLNCAALPEALAEDELFGHAKGAFSGATGERAGRVEAAHGGTLFLDEVGELPLALQAKLLRTLQNGEIQRLGEDRPRQVDARIVSATNRNLHDGVRAGRFRADLYHRLSVYPVPVPPLRERGADVLLLCGRFLEINRARLGLRGLRLAADAELALLRYDWPGNVRELEHVISRAAIRAVGRGAARHELITLEAGLLGLEAPPAAPPAMLPDPPAAATLSWRDAVDDFERRLLRSRLDAAGGSWAGAARTLGLDPSNLHKRARRLGLK